MGQKINPISVRLNVNRHQNSLWFSKNNYTKNLHKQILLKTYISKVFQVSNLPLGPCYIQILPKKLKIFPFFNNSNKPSFSNKRSSLFRRYIQSKYPKNRTLNSNSVLPRHFLLNSYNKCWKKDLFLWQNSKLFFRLFSKLSSLQKNKKDDSKNVFRKSRFLENEDRTCEEEKSEFIRKSDFSILKSEIKKDIFRFSKLAKRNKKLIHDSRNDVTWNNQLELNSFLDRQNKKKNYQVLVQWIFYNLYSQFKRNELLITTKQAWFLFFQFVLTKNVQYILNHNLSKTASLRKSYLSTKYLNVLESHVEKKLLCNSSILPFKVENEYKSAHLLANYLSIQLAKNRSHRQVLKRVFQKAKKFSFLKGIRIACSGRLGGVELAKTEVKKMGQTSLNIFAEKIDYSSTKVSTKFGIIGVKVWLCYV